MYNIRYITLQNYIFSAKTPNVMPRDEYFMSLDRCLLYVTIHKKALPKERLFVLNRAA